MPTKPKKERKRVEHRPMPEGPRLLAQAMFRYGDKKMREKRAAEAAQGQPVTPRQRIA